MVKEAALFMAGHWYDRITGDLYGPVPTKTGELRDFDMRDARKVLALSGVTGILNILSKPGLVKWQVMQGIKAAAQYDWIMIPNPKDLEAVFSESKEYVHFTQDFGDATHKWVHSKLTGKPMTLPPLIPKSEEAADYLVEWLAANGFEITETEHHFVNQQLGWGGTCDLQGTHYGDPFIGDIKTQSDPLSFYDPEHPLQLAGYSLGLGLVPDIKRISIILNRDEFAVKQKLWTENARYDEAFMGLAQLWMLLNKYDPRGPLE